MQVYIPIVTYRLPCDENWAADAFGLEGAVTEGLTSDEAKRNLLAVLEHYVAMLTPADAIQAAELDYFARLTSPPEGVDWISLPKSSRPNAEIADAS